MPIMINIVSFDGSLDDYRSLLKGCLDQYSLFFLKTSFDQHRSLLKSSLKQHMSFLKGSLDQNRFLLKGSFDLLILVDSYRSLLIHVGFF